MFLYFSLAWQDNNSNAQLWISSQSPRYFKRVVIFHVYRVGMLVQVEREWFAQQSCGRGRRVCRLGPQLASERQDCGTFWVVKQKHVRCCLVSGVWGNSTDPKVQQRHCHRSVPGSPLPYQWGRDSWLCLLVAALCRVLVLIMVIWCCCWVSWLNLEICNITCCYGVTFCWFLF